MREKEGGPPVEAAGLADGAIAVEAIPDAATGGAARRFVDEDSSCFAKDPIIGKEPPLSA